MQQISPAPLPADRHIMRRDEVELKTGFKRSHIYNLMKAGLFPNAGALVPAPSAGTRWRSSSGSMIDCRSGVASWTSSR